MSSSDNGTETTGADEAPASNAPAELSVRSSTASPLLRTLGIIVGFVGLAVLGLFAQAHSGTQLPAPDSANQREPTLQAELAGSWLAPVPNSATGASQPPPKSECHCPEPTPCSTASAPSASANESASGITADGKVILNLASSAELERLPGVGTKRAQKIVALREKLKGFKKATQLLRIKGIGVRSLRKMLPELVLNAPKPPPIEPSTPQSTAGAPSPTSSRSVASPQGSGRQTLNEH